MSFGILYVYIYRICICLFVVINIINICKIFVKYIPARHWLISVLSYIVNMLGNNVTYKAYHALNKNVQLLFYGSAEETVPFFHLINNIVNLVVRSLGDLCANIYFASVVILL